LALRLFSLSGLKGDPYNFELYRFKDGAFLETRCTV